MRIIVVAVGFLFSSISSVLVHTMPIIFFMGGDTSELKPQQWQLTAEAAPVLQRVVDEFKIYNDRYVLIVGYDENASTAAFSYARSLKRAEAVRDALIGLGLPGDALVVKACGSSDPLVNVAGKEPQNRRVIFEGSQTLQALLYVDRRICPGVQPPP